MSGGRFSVEAIFRAVDRISAPVSAMQQRLSRFTRVTEAGLRRVSAATGKVASGVKKMAKGAAVGIALMGGAMGNVIAVGAQFEQSIVNASARFPGEIRRGTEAYEGLETAARSVGRTTEFTASQAAEALNYMAMAGFDAEGAVGSLPGVVDLATAAQVDLAVATDIATDSMGAFGMASATAEQRSANLARVSDVLAKTSTSANMSISTMFEAVKDGAPVAVTAGASIETFAAMVGTLANAGIKGSRAGTTLKNMFLSLAAPVEGGAKMLKALHISTKDAKGDMRDMFDIMDDITRATEGMGSGTKSGVLEAIFGKIPIAGVNVLLKQGGEALREYRGQIEAASGTTHAMAEIMRDTVSGSINALKSAIESVSITIFAMERGPLKDAIDRTTDWIRANEQMIATDVAGYIGRLLGNFSEVVTWIKRIAIGLGTLWALNAVLDVLVGTITLVNLVMSANPVGLFVVVLGAMIAAVTLLVVRWDAFVSALRSTGPIFDALLIAFSGLLGPIGMLAAGAAMIIKYWAPLKEFFTGLWSEITSGFDAAVAKITRGLDILKNMLSFASSFASEAGGSVAEMLGFGGDDATATTAPTAQVVTQEERIARSIEQSSTTNTAEVRVSAGEGAQVETSGTVGPNATLITTGDF